MARGLLVCSWLTTGLPALAGAAEPGASASGLSSVLADEKARQTFKEGIAAFDRRDFEAARIAFLQTFALKPTVPVVRRNLGLAEIFSGHYLEGARRLARVIHTTGEGTAEDRARMLESLRKAEAHLERITVEVNVDGAAVTVDGVDLGSSPVPFMWYVAPGPYVVQVAKTGFASASLSRVARAGAVQHLRITLEPEQSAPPPGVDAPAPVMSGGRTNPWIVAAGILTTAAGVGAGIGFSVSAANNADKAEQLRGSLLRIGCTGSPLPQCAELYDAAEAHDDQVRWATVSFIAAGVTAASTVFYALLSSSDYAAVGHPSRAPHATAAVALDVDEAGALLRVRGAF